MIHEDSVAGSQLRIVLASTSPSRLSILRSAGVEPIVEPSGVDERAAVAQLTDPSPEAFVSHLAEAKARAVYRRRKDNGTISNEVVIGGDSMLLLDGKLQGKPYTIEKTVARWQTQRGKVAHLITGHCVIYQGESFTKTATTAVHFGTVSDSDIRAYAETHEPLLCAGAFTLEAIGGWFIDKIEGDPSSVIGLSLPVVRQSLEHFGLRVSDFWNL